MPSIALYLKTHQPFRIKHYRAFDVGYDHEYFNDTGEANTNNVKILKKICEKSYKPTNKILLDLLNKHPEFTFSLSLSGTLLEQLETYAPATNFLNVSSVAGA